MQELHTTLFLLFKTIFAYFILYILLPSRLITFDEYGDEWLDKVYISMVHGHFFIIIAVHFLVALRIYETISLAILIIVFVVCYFSLYSARGANAEDIQRKSVPAFLLDLMDGRIGVMENLRRGTVQFFKNLGRGLKNGLIHAATHPFDGIVMLAMLCAAFVLRLRHAFSHLYYGASDVYVHLAWTKYMGVNRIYHDGVYPYGYEAVVSALNKLFFIDPAVILRFFGAIGSFLLVLSVYYFLKKNIKNQYIIIFAAVFAVAFGTEFPNAASNMWRQLSSLPQEYATLFLLPGGHFLNLFYNTGRKKYLALAAEVLAIAVFIHFYAALFVVALYALLSLLHLKKLFFEGTFARVLLYMAGGGLVGIAPILIALGLGKKFHSLSYDYVSDVAKTAGELNWRQEMFRFAETDRTLLLLLICVGLILLYSIVRMAFKRTPEYSGRIRLFLAVAFLNLLIYTQIRAVDVGYPSLMEGYRASTFLTATVAALYAFGVYLFEMIPLPRIIRYAFKTVGAVVIITVTFNAAHIHHLFPDGAKLEYDESAYLYYDIKENFPILNWTIVSTVEQYSQSMGYGWHYNLWEFVYDTQVKPKEEVEFPTDYLFVIVEKHPLNQALPHTLTKQITPEDAGKPFPEVTGSSDKYYTVYENRRIIQAKAYYWMEDYIKKNGGFTVYFENDLVKAYMLHQDGTKPVNLASKTTVKEEE